MNSSCRVLLPIRDISPRSVTDVRVLSRLHGKIAAEVWLRRTGVTFSETYLMMCLSKKKRVKFYFIVLDLRTGLKNGNGKKKKVKNKPKLLNLRASIQHSKKRDTPQFSTLDSPNKIVIQPITQNQFLKI